MENEKQEDDHSHLLIFAADLCRYTSHLYIPTLIYAQETHLCSLQEQDYTSFDRSPLSYVTPSGAAISRSTISIPERLGKRLLKSAI